MVYYGFNDEMLARRFKAHDLAYGAELLLPKCRQSMTAFHMPKFPLGIRKGSYINQLMVGGRLIRARLHYLGFSSKLLRGIVSAGMIDYYKDIKRRYLFFETRHGIIFVEHSQCALVGGSTTVHFARKIIPKK